MSVDKAKAYYLGKSGHRRLNCAEAVVHAFQEKFHFSEQSLAQLRACGGGRAPGGLCGALYAVKTLLEAAHPEQVRECERDFLTRAGSGQCRGIRALKKLSCVGCVESVAEHIERI